MGYFSAYMSRSKNNDTPCQICPFFTQPFPYVPGYWDPARVPGLPIRDCVISSKNLVSRVAKVNTIIVTEKSTFERLYLVLGLRQFATRVNCSCAPTPPPLTQRLFLDFCAIFFQVAPHFFGHHDSPSNLVESPLARALSPCRQNPSNSTTSTVRSATNSKQMQTDATGCFGSRLVPVPSTRPGYLVNRAVELRNK